MTLPSSAHTSRPWRIHELTEDFGLEDVWALPASGSREEFPRLLEAFALRDRTQTPLAVRALWAIRTKLGGLLGWDDAGSGLGARVPTLRERLPADLRAALRDPNIEAPLFTPIYLLEDEWAGEIANRTIHAVVHLGWVPDAAGSYRGQMAVLVKPNGLLGHAYMAAIRPFRHLIVYPSLMRQIERAWRDRDEHRSGTVIA
jgi:hypothetical protein